MVGTLERRFSLPKSRSFRFRKLFEIPGKQLHNLIEGGDTPKRQQSFKNGDLPPLDHKSQMQREKSYLSRLDSKGGKSSHLDKPLSDMEVMKERFAKLLLGEDMSGGGKGVCSALALSNAITNLAASVFGQQTKLEPMSAERKARWRKEIEWMLSVTDHIVEFVPSKQIAKDGLCTEIMMTKQRADLRSNIPALRKLEETLIDALEIFKNQDEFWYVPRDANDSDNEETQKNDDKWWLPIVKVPLEGISEASRTWLQQQKDYINQVFKTAMATNVQVLSAMKVPDSYIESLPKNGRATLGDSIYKSITEEYFDPENFVSAMDLSSEDKVLDITNKIEASIVIWKRKLHHKDGKATWGSGVSLEKREVVEERAEIILLLLKQRFPGTPQSLLDISKIHYNMDIGLAVLESYSRIIESLAFNILSKIEDVLYADSLTRVSLSSAESVESARFSDPGEETDNLIPTGTPTSETLATAFTGWSLDAPSRKHHGSMGKLECYIKAQPESPAHKSNYRPLTPKQISYLEKLESLSGQRSPHDRRSIW